MPPLVVFPPADTVVIGLLAAQLPPLGADVPVSANVQDPRPDRFVTVRRSGGPRDSIYVDAAQINVECWSDSDTDAADLAELARAVIHAARGTVQAGVTITRTNEFAGPAYLPDPTSNQFRYVFTVQVYTRGTAPN